MDIVGNDSQTASNEKTSPDPTTIEKQTASRSLILYTAIALGLALFIRFFIAAPYIVSGASMEPTFDNLHYLIIDRVSYELGEPARGDVIVFDLPTEPGRSLIKRVIGLPEETVIISENAVIIQNAEHPEGFTLDEPYLDQANLGGGNDMRVILEQGEYFVLGDNRHVSSDSRVWGALPRETIVGRVFLRLYPLNMMDALPGEARYEE
ncbi:MAG: Signal peptidase I [Candidatus Kaiserbacteria bacterium GW2011_GWC2_49_12]|uniref:Signal peptidase I n=4 Tax=Candidatus Kaiseribacteriota TaxID=1752734 RepID=A0A0G1YQN4_9BACT|nr:MAG: Signal peptidase I [Candidatus Kaiserbacteria bacterium GW2011_GWC2_49_12]KKW09283.1 MAG: Signal peptidase I [Candidatus Kaiserbacteria bacterium GW2011_GWA2_49_56]KKW17317.1 MAG: Signal peptidase I [Candidatus Kaiserbacteria bacterium GW2011_GWB1_50_17]KKW18183.1 MAG: Signal peptidase I [Candidatus Kaiserbacteria bacterium GW2011_GWA1_50_28]